MEENLDEKLKEIRKILDDPFHTTAHKDKYLATLKRRLMQSPPAADSPHIVIFSKDTLEKKEEEIGEEFTVKEREGEVVEGETLFTIEREETVSIPEFIEVKPEEETTEREEEKTQEYIEAKPEEEKIPEFVEIKPEEEVKPEEEIPIEKPEEEKKEEEKSVEVEAEEASKLPEWKPIEEEIVEEKKIEVEEKKEAEGAARKKKTREKKRRKIFKTWEPAKERKIAKEKKRREKKEVESFEPFLEEDFEEEIEEEGEKGKDKGKVEGKSGEICRYKGYTLYRKEITLTDGSKKVIHFFSKEETDEGEPSPLPKGYEIKLDRKTGIPFIRRKR